MLKRSLLSLCIASSLLVVSACDSDNPVALLDEGSNADTSDADSSGDDATVEGDPMDGDSGSDGADGDTDAADTDAADTDGNDTDSGATDAADTDAADTDGGATDGAEDGGDTDGGDDGAPDDGGDSDGPVPPTPTGPSEFEASYRLTFEATWSPATHALNFPAGPHFSGVTGSTHNGAVNLWRPGQLATAGFRNVAETGNRSLFIEEIRASVAAGSSGQLIEGGGVNPSPGSVSVNFQASQQHPLVSIVTMVAPSPDWVVGVHGLDLRGVDGNFVDSLIVDAKVYDAGTDSGTRYASGNIETNPRAPITLLTSNSGDTDIVQGLPSVGRFIFQKQ